MTLGKWAMFAGGVAVLAGCASTGPGSSQHPYWPKPPDPARFMYESVIRSELDILKNTRTDTLRTQLTGFNPKADTAFLKPYDVAARGGRILVSDSGGTRVHLFDIPNGTLFRIGRSEKGKLIQPSGVAIDVKGRIYVADVRAKQVVVYNELGHFLHTLGNGEVFSKPSDVAVSNSGDRVYVVDFGGISNDRHRVLMFNQQGEQIGAFGQHGRGAGELHLASHIAVGPDDNVYVLDAGNFRVQVFDRDGQFLRAWGKVGVNIGDFARPRGLALDRDGNVYVTDGTFGNFQIFTPDGKLLMWIGNTGLEDKPGQYALPAGIAIDDQDFVFVVDQMYNKIEVLRRLSSEESDRLARNMPLNRSLRGPAAPLKANTVTPPAAQNANSAMPAAEAVDTPPGTEPAAPAETTGAAPAPEAAAPAAR
jgi:DNA-binding beta-propeller fold protein YncE